MLQMYQSTNVSIEYMNFEKNFTLTGRLIRVDVDQHFSQLNISNCRMSKTRPADTL